MSFRTAVPLGIALLSALSGCGREDGGSRPPSNVLLVTIDTLRADHVGIYGGKAATPNLDRLAREGAYFTETFAQSPLTLPSHSSILTGTYPTYHGVRDNGRFRLPESIDTLAEILKRAGWATGAFVGGFPVDSRFGLGQGFDRYDDDFGGTGHARLAFAERRAEVVVARAKEWLSAADRKGERIFAWVHLFDPHAPYAPPAPFDADADPYDGEIAYVDRALGALLESLSRDTLVVVTADHGEGLGDHGEATHSLFVYDSTLRVPLIVHGPGVRSGTVVNDAARSIDIVPTVLDLVGRPQDCAHCQGRSLVPALEGGPLAPVASYAETYFPRLNLGWSELKSLREGGWKLIDAPEVELYEVSTDPGETRNVASTHPEKVKELRSALGELVAETSGGDTSAAAALAAGDVDPKTLATLRSLGYLSAARTPRPPSEAALADPKSRLAVWEGVRKGMELVARGDTEGAIDELEGLLAKEPELVLARSYLAAAYFDRGRYRDAAGQCSAILAAEPEDFDATLLLGRSLLRMGEREKAKGLLERAASLDPDSPDPWVEMAQLQLHQRAASEAETAIAEARRRDPEAPGVLLVEGKLSMAKGDLASAEAAFRRALAAAPGEEEPRAQLGNLLLTQRRLAEAETLFRDGLREHPGSSDLHSGLGNCLALSGRMNEAIPELERALALSPDSPMVLNSLGFAYGQTGRAEKGLALLRRSLELAPDQPELRDFLRQAHP